MVGIVKFFFRLRREVFLQASRGPNPGQEKRNSPKGILTLLKNGALTVRFSPCSASDKHRKIVPHRTANMAASNTRLLKRKLLSREITDSRRFSLFKSSSRVMIK